MRKSILLALVFSLCLVGFSMAETLFGFNYASDSAASADWIIGGNDIATTWGATMVVGVETTVNKEGTSALKMQYGYSGHQWYEAFIHKVFPTVQDWGVYNKYKFWFYNPNAADSTNLMWYFQLYTNSGNCYRYANYGGFADQGWKEHTVDLAMMSIDQWVGGGFGTSPNLSAVSAFRFLIQQQTGIPSAGTTTVYLDDFRGFKKSNLSATADLFDFNYASTDALTTAWVPSAYIYQSQTVTLSLNSSVNPGSMSLYYNITTRWQNAKVEYTFPATQDMSAIKYFKVWLYGDVAADTTLGPLFQLMVQDTVGTGNRAYGRITYQGLKYPTWNAYFMPFVIGPMAGSTGPWWQDTWDYGRGTTNIDKAAIGKMGVYMQTGATGNVAFNLYLDDIQYGYATSVPLLASYYNINAQPGSAAIPINVNSGIGPFTWTISSGIGTLSATTGSSVNYTPGSTITTGTITVFDDTGDSWVIPVIVSPNSAPLASEPAFATTSRSIHTDWSLVE